VAVGRAVAVHGASGRAALSGANRRRHAPRAPDLKHVGCHPWLKCYAPGRDAGRHAYAGIVAPTHKMTSALGHKRTFAPQNVTSALPPDSGRESGLSQKVMSALPTKADMCGAVAHVCYGPIADIRDISHADYLNNRGKCLANPKQNRVK